MSNGKVWNEVCEGLKGHDVEEVALIEIHISQNILVLPKMEKKTISQVPYP